MKLKRPIPGNIVHSIIDLNEDVSVIDRHNCSVLGWGSTVPDKVVKSTTLLELNIPVLNDLICQAQFGKSLYNIEKMLCAGNLRGGKSICVGDSGGPLVCTISDKPNYNVLVGIISFGTQICAMRDYPTVFTRISAYIGWIEARTTARVYKHATTTVAAPIIPLTSYKHITTVAEPTITWKSSQNPWIRTTVQQVQIPTDVKKRSQVPSSGNNSNGANWKTLLIMIGVVISVFVISGIAFLTILFFLTPEQTKSSKTEQILFKRSYLNRSQQSVSQDTFTTSPSRSKVQSSISVSETKNSSNIKSAKKTQKIFGSKIRETETSDLKK